MNLSEGSTFFYGVYTIIEVTHEFKQGKFTQRLKGYRDTLINIEQLRQADPVETSRNQPQQVPAAQPSQTAQVGPSGQPLPAGQTLHDATLANPNANPANLAKGTQQSVMGVDSTQSPPTFSSGGGYIHGRAGDAQRAADDARMMARADVNNEEFIEGARVPAPRSGSNISGEGVGGYNITGQGVRTTSLTGDGGLREPSLTQPRSLPNTRQATYDRVTDTFGNDSAGPGETVDYGNASLQALGLRRNLG
jgi:hypothetical protein